MDIFKFCGIGIYSVFAVLVIRELRREISQTASFGIFAVILCISLPMVGEFVEFAVSFSDGINSSCSESIAVLIKALGIAYITYIASEICKHAGEGSIASQVELVGRMEIMILCIPFLKKLLSFVLI